MKADASPHMTDHEAKLLQTYVIVNRDIPKGSLVREEARLLASVSSVPISVEILTGESDNTEIMGHSLSAGTYTVHSVLDDMCSQDSLITWQLVNNSIFISIRDSKGLKNPLDLRLIHAYTGDLTVQDWVTWLYKQAPVTGFDLESPDATRDENKIYCVLKGGLTIREVFAAITNRTGGVWTFNISENNHVVNVHMSPDGVHLLPLTDAQIKYLNQVATGDQLGRTRVYYNPRRVDFDLTPVNKSRMPQ